jgi:hypothetical protein
LESQGTPTTLQTEEGNAATKEATTRASDGDPDHHNRDATTAKTQEQGRQEIEGDNETQSTTPPNGSKNG